MGLAAVLAGPVPLHPSHTARRVLHGTPPLLRPTLQSSKRTPAAPLPQHEGGPSMKKLFAALAVATLAVTAFFATATHPTFADQRDFRLHNRSGAVITHVYVSPASSDYWGEDVLETDVVYPGDYRDILFSRFD